MIKAIAIAFTIFGVFQVFSDDPQYSQLEDVNPEIKILKYATWEGEFNYSHYQKMKIEGQKELYMIFYRLKPNVNDGSVKYLIDFATLGENDKFSYLKQGGGNDKGVMPIFLNVLVFPGKDTAEVVLLWRHPGNGGFLTAQKYEYNSKSLALIDQSDGGGLGWSRSKESKSIW